MERKHLNIDDLNQLNKVICNLELEESNAIIETTGIANNGSVRVKGEFGIDAGYDTFSFRITKIYIFDIGSKEDEIRD